VPETGQRVINFAFANNTLWTALKPTFIALNYENQLPQCGATYNDDMPE